MTSIHKIIIASLAALAASAANSVFAAEAETGTIDKGGAQLEFKMGLTRYDRDADISLRERSTPFLARIGLGNNAELRIETPGSIRSVGTLRSNGAKATITGTGDTSVGVRWRQTDMDEKAGTPALAWMFTVGLPTGKAPFKGDGTSTNLKVAAEWNLGNDASLGIMPGILREKNGDGKWYAAPNFAVTLGKNWTPAFRTTVELVAPRLTTKANGGNEATFNFGNTYSINDNIELEAVYLRGLTSNTAESSFVFGVNVKF
jgi:Putative MetA-pathway of phenol degradation